MNRKRLVAFGLAAGLALAAASLAQETSAEDAMRRAKELYRNGSYSAAIDELSTVLEAEPERADALYLRGYSHLMLRRYDQSVEDFARAFAADPTFDPRTIYQPASPESETRLRQGYGGQA